MANKNSNWTTLRPENLDAQGAKILKALQDANKVAADARKALHAHMTVTLFGPKGAPPAGKELVVMAKWGGVSMGIVDAKEGKSSKPGTLAEWLAQQAA